MKRPSTPPATQATEESAGTATEQPQHEQELLSPPRRLLFRSGLCDMFHSNRFSKTDACALAFCGIWLWERNRYLLTGERPRCWRDRPLETSIVVLLVVTAIVWSLDPTYSFSSVAMVIVLCFFLWKIFEFQYARSVFRQQLAIDACRRETRKRNEHVGGKPTMDEETTKELGSNEQRVQFSDPQDDLDPDLMLFLGDHQREIYGDGSHALCGCASSRLNPQEPQNGDDQDGQGDFCFNLWKLLSSFCCEIMCQCYCQLCGMCAIAQEHRYLAEILPSDPDLWQRDYITLQPWNEYYPKILRLRIAHQTHFVSHVKALSTLSFRLMIAIAIFLVIVTLLVLLPVHFPRWQILVLYGTLLHPIIILFFVYWCWHRMDVSLDAVVKYFASGFFICTAVSVLYESMASLVASAILFFVGLMGTLGMILAGSIDMNGILAEVDDDEIGDGDPEHYVPPVAYSISIALITAFLNAFFVAALVEELGKYLSFWMVEHPDLARGSVVLSITSKDVPVPKDVKEVVNETTKLNCHNDANKQDNDQVVWVPVPSLVATGAATTVTMITTALGFSCAENLLYVFIYTPTGLNEELATLITRCLFPIHPLAAALQSLGVCRRDLENDPKYQVGRILFPAWLLHGTFDFSLMAYSLIARILSPPEGNEGDETSSSGTQHLSSDFDSAALIVSCVMIIPLIAVVYYFKEAWDQRDRLEALDRQNRIVI